MWSPPYFCLEYIQTKVRWRFCKKFWPSQNIWTLFYSINWLWFYQKYRNIDFIFHHVLSKMWFLGSSKIYSSINRGSIFKCFHIYLFLSFTFKKIFPDVYLLDNVNFSIFISFYNIFFCTSNDQCIIFLVSIWKLYKLFQISFFRISKCFHNFWMICNKTNHGEICKHTHTLLRILY